MFARLMQYYKGGFYLYFGAAYNSESEDKKEEWVVYYSLEKQKMLIRPFAMFHEIVPWPEGHCDKPCVHPRFLEVSEMPLSYLQPLYDFPRENWPSCDCKCGCNKPTDMRTGSGPYTYRCMQCYAFKCSRYVKPVAP